MEFVHVDGGPDSPIFPPPGYAPKPPHNPLYGKLSRTLRFPAEQIRPISDTALACDLHVDEEFCQVAFFPAWRARSRLLRFNHIAFSDHVLS
jgi:hypothetical protein